MLVDYEVNGEKKHHEGHGSGSLILLPNNATKIKVRFQVMRFPGVWSDVKEYDRFEKCWVEPTEPHIFEYEKPVSCTYTLAVNLYGGKITGEYHDDIYDTDDENDFNTHVFYHDDIYDTDDENDFNRHVFYHDDIYDTDDENDFNSQPKQDIPSDQALRTSQEMRSISSQNIGMQESPPRVQDETASVIPVKGSNNEWFEENVFNENYDIKEVYVNELRSERFSWIKDFHIGIDKEKKSWQICITYARNTKPCMEDLKNLFGDNIASFVEFIRESDDEDEERLRTSSCFLRAPSSGDTLYLQNEKRGTIAVLAAQIRSDEKHYVITSYHVCYCFNDLPPENIFEAHNKLKEDCCSNDAAGCIGSRYQYMDQEKVLGVFECGLYDDKNDIALIALEKKLTCDDAIAFLENGVESELLSKTQVGKIFTQYVNMGKLPTVKKHGSASNETEGELFAITTTCQQNNMNDGFYRIRGKNADNFAKKGDSGALVYIAHESKNLPFAIVSNHVPNENVYYCPNLHQSIEALNEKYNWININWIRAAAARRSAPRN
ncbi:uncharacterized protein LOC114525882 [Dendronephthya gigantea]|uniref:uncharacterized protein LOC114525882 n=1 Tax=Dendronephthya gigantea TaxID=151771 RepID=UPI00106AB6C8|nr:uncharacterized protein LOC114525882 [Dendronephthya gigantea]